MKNKVLIKIYVPTIDEEYELYIPINESVKKVMELIINSVYELSDSSLDKNVDHYLMDPNTSSIYNYSQIIRETNIRNSKKVVLI